jgi:hypothetical protein
VCFGKTISSKLSICHALPVVTASGVISFFFDSKPFLLNPQQHLLKFAGIYRARRRISASPISDLQNDCATFYHIFTQSTITPKFGAIVLLSL